MTWRTRSKKHSSAAQRYSLHKQDFIDGSSLLHIIDRICIPVQSVHSALPSASLYFPTSHGVHSPSSGPVEPAAHKATAVSFCRRRRKRAAIAVKGPLGCAPPASAMHLSAGGGLRFLTIRLWTPPVGKPAGRDIYTRMQRRFCMPCRRVKLTGSTQQKEPAGREQTRPVSSCSTSHGHQPSQTSACQWKWKTARR